METYALGPSLKNPRCETCHTYIKDDSICVLLKYTCTMARATIVNNSSRMVVLYLDLVINYYGYGQRDGLK